MLFIVHDVQYDDEIQLYKYEQLEEKAEKNYDSQFQEYLDAKYLCNWSLQERELGILLKDIEVPDRSCCFHRNLASF